MTDVRYVQVEATGTGYAFDPNPYLDHLELMRDELPAGARAFATDPDHYNVRSERCVKDLKLVTLTVADASGQLSVQVRFQFNEVAPEVLEIGYRDVLSIDVSVSDSGPHRYPPDAQTRRLSDVQLDEILPHPWGCAHEIQFIKGTITVIAADLEAGWVARS